MDPATVYLKEAIRRAETAREELDIEVKGLRLALARRLQEQGRPPEQQTSELVAEEPISAETSQWRMMARTDAVERVLAEAGGELHRKEVTTRLVEAGRGDNIDAVSAALAYMARGDHPRVESLGHGRWRLRTASSAPLPPASSNGHEVAPSEAKWPGIWTGPDRTVDSAEEVTFTQG